jgi:hypothetical protein
MSEKQDFTIPNGLGIRIVDGRICQVIRKQRGVWKEIGKPYDLPLHDEDLVWTRNGIPVSVIAVALRAYELDNPTSQLRQQLTDSRVLSAVS